MTRQASDQNKGSKESSAHVSASIREHELSLIWGPVPNQILLYIWPKYKQRLQHSAPLVQAYQENTIDIGLDTFPSLVSISTVRECVTKTL